MLVTPAGIGIELPGRGAAPVDLTGAFCTDAGRHGSGAICPEPISPAVTNCPLIPTGAGKCFRYAGLP